MNTNRDKAGRPEVSVVIPMYNERENAPATLAAVAAELEGVGVDFELVPVNDGSVDGTDRVLADMAAADGRIRPAGYAVNAGRGRALRTGFEAARGEIVCSIDADLSYSPDHVTTMLRTLRQRPEIDVVLASAYMPGGRAEGVPAKRLWISRLGNRLLSLAMPGRFSTITCVVRAYRRRVLESLDLESDGKEIHLEILSKVLSLGFRVLEVPAVLRNRRQGTSKARVGPTVLSHLHFTFVERPILLFGFLGMICILIGIGIGAYIAYLWRMASLNPARPMMTLMVLLLLGGLQLVSFGLLAVLIGLNRRELYRIQRQNRDTRRLLEERTRPGDPPGEG